MWEEGVRIYDISGVPNNFSYSTMLIKRKNRKGLNSMNNPPSLSLSLSLSVVNQLIYESFNTTFIWNIKYY